MARLWDQADAGQAQLLMSVVNAGEVFYLVAKARGEEAAHTVWKNLQSRPVEILPAPKPLALHAATLKARHPAGRSPGDGRPGNEAPRRGGAAPGVGGGIAAAYAATRAGKSFSISVTNALASPNNISVLSM